MASDRRTLVHGFRRAGWRTVAAMPAITMPWPEGDYFGFDTVYAAADLGYRGDPFNWVTMPDQYTLAALQRLEFARPGAGKSGPERQARPPVMATLALIYSPAPWPPLPPVKLGSASGREGGLPHAEIPVVAGFLNKYTEDINMRT